MANFVRVTLSLTRDLKRRMDAVKDRVNWSEIARRAIERELEEMKRMQRIGDNMAKTVTRLRKTKEEGESRSYQEGWDHGKTWAADRADWDELARLSEADLDFGESNEDTSAYSNAELLFFAINPGCDRDRGEATAFWECHADRSAGLDNGFLQGFSEAAVALFEKVKDSV